MAATQRQERALRRREEILEEATKLFAAKGYAHAKVDDIAARLGIAKGTIYRYFSTKRELFLAVADNAMTELQDSMEAITSKIDDPLERISAGVKAHLAFFDVHRDLIEVFVHERAEFRDRKKPTFLSYREKNIRNLEALLEDMKKAGLVRDVSASATAEILGDMLAGTVHTHFIRGSGRRLSRLAPRIVDVFFNGILTPAGGRARQGRPAPRSRAANKVKKK